MHSGLVSPASRLDFEILLKPIPTRLTRPDTVRAKQAGWPGLEQHKVGCYALNNRSIIVKAKYVTDFNVSVCDFHQQGVFYPNNRKAMQTVRPRHERFKWE